MATVAQREHFGIIDLGDDRTLLTWGEGPVLGAADDWQRAIRETSDSKTQAWSKGWLGWLAYESGGQFESMPPAKTAEPQIPEIALFRHQGALIHHKQSESWTITGSSNFRQQARDISARSRDSSSTTSPLTGKGSGSGPRTSDMFCIVTLTPPARLCYRSPRFTRQPRPRAWPCTTPWLGFRSGAPPFSASRSASGPPPPWPPCR